MTDTATASSSQIEPQKPEWRWQDTFDAQRAHAVLLSVLLIGALPWTHQFKPACLVYFVAIAICTVYIGAHRGLTPQVRTQLSFQGVRFFTSVLDSHAGAQQASLQAPTFKESVRVLACWRSVSAPA